MSLKRKISVFGTLYTVEFIEKPTQHMFENLLNGVTDFDKKEIQVLCGEDEDEILKHEMIHAHLWECGLHTEATDEKLVCILSEIYGRMDKLAIKDLYTRTKAITQLSEIINKI